MMNLPYVRLRAVRARAAAWVTPRAPARSAIKAIGFEKDDDANHHIDFVHAASNLRARNCHPQLENPLPLDQMLQLLVGVRDPQLAAHRSPRARWAHKWPASGCHHLAGLHAVA